MTVAIDLDATRRTQRRASDPAASAWVVANAGAGKTHVLTQRVVRLLLSGVEPDAILCLTFTKIAAAEMSRRIFATLGEWATLSDGDLAARIADLEGRPPKEAELRAARRLFARALETPGGLKIQTIHAFCERLLHQFPFEANVPAEFGVLDDNSAAALIAEARSDVLALAAARPDGPVGLAVRHLAEHATDAQIEPALDAVIAAREAIGRWIVGSAGDQGGVADALADLRVRLGLAERETESSICAEICAAAGREKAGWEKADCAALVAALAGSDNRNDRNAHAALTAICGADAEIVEADRRIEFFLAGDKVRQVAQRFGAAAARSVAGLKERFSAEGERVAGLAARLRLARTYEATAALLVVGDAILQAYSDAKRRSGSLDFSDLIVRTRNLLQRSDAAQWVLYRLDRRIDHILVDEAQDTSPDQWAVVKALAEDFFSGAGARATIRTIFVVGDDKQSIFGFQGAAPHMVKEMQDYFAARTATAGARFGRHALQLSFRSTREILQAVDEVFAGDLRQKVTASGYEEHAAQRFAEPGEVVLLPRRVRARASEPDDWMTPLDAPAAAELRLADDIAAEVKRRVGTPLPSGKRLREAGVLILTRRRDAFFTAMNRALRKAGLAAAGADRIPIATHIATLDLLALGDVMLLPEDDLQLAALLKSPLVGIDEDTLMHLAAGRSGSLWEALHTSDDATCRGAAARLSGWLAMADQAPPFRFFATVLGPDGGRRAFRARLGGEAEDVLDAFLSQALAYEAIEPPSLQGFLAFVRASRTDIKREAEQTGEGIRVMTVHGAKGLEADAVFVVDTGGLIVVTGHREVLVPIGTQDDPAFLWRRRKDEAIDLQRAADAAADEAARREYLRLLYVAMTRARDVLYVCGVRGERTDANCWYKLVERALAGEAIRDAETGELAGPVRWPQPPRAGGSAEPGPAAASVAPEAWPAWLAMALPPPAATPTLLRPSRALAEPDPPPPGRIGGGGGAGAANPFDRAMLQGRLIHKLLQVLPGLDAARREDAAARILARQPGLDADLAAAISGEVAAVLADPALAPLFAAGSRAEAPIVGRLATASGAVAVSGQIDRLVGAAGGWLIADFKTNRAVPASPDEVEPGYLLQLALYRRLLMDLRPGAAVAAALVYTAGPKIMPIPAATLERALAGLGVGETAVS